MVPELFRSHVLTQKINIYTALTGREMRPEPDNETAVDVSLRLFTKRFIESGLFGELVKQETKDSSIDMSGLTLRHSWGAGYKFADLKTQIRALFQGEDIPEDFFFDGDFGFILRDVDTNVGVCTSFNMIDPTAYERAAHKIDGEYQLEEGEVLIRQLQGPLQKWQRYRAKNDLPERSPLIENLRWEFVLIDTISLWARNCGFDRVFMQPVDRNDYFIVNQYRPGSKEKHERGKLRYDITGKRIGFKENAYGLMERNLAELRPSFITALGNELFSS